MLFKFHSFTITPLTISSPKLIQIIFKHLGCASHRKWCFFVTMTNLFSSPTPGSNLLSWKWKHLASQNIGTHLPWHHIPGDFNPYIQNKTSNLTSKWYLATLTMVFILVSSVGVGIRCHCLDNCELTVHDCFIWLYFCYFFTSDSESVGNCISYQMFPLSNVLLFSPYLLELLLPVCVGF